MKKSLRVGIIGGGASGLMAAVTAAKAGAQVSVLEKNGRVGKKILATGNGKCNFTNMTLSSEDYYSQCSTRLADYFGQFSNTNILSYFQSNGILTKSRDGFCYPRTEQASTVLDMFRNECKAYQVNLITDCLISAVKKKNNTFCVYFEDGNKMEFERIILACGSYASETKLPNFSGYDMAKLFGHKIEPVLPALTQVVCAGKDWKAIAGVRCQGCVSLYVDDKLTSTETGEIQLTEYGLSGFPVFQLSRFVAKGHYEGKKMHAFVDFLPELSKEQWKEIVLKKIDSINQSSTTMEAFLNGFLHKKLNTMFIRQYEIKSDALMKDISKQTILSICLGMKTWKVKVLETKPFVNAQVCQGGVSLDKINQNMESMLVPGLFFAGEMVDVDGRCGGYNLQWAWTSGYIAGKNAAI